MDEQPSDREMRKRRRDLLREIQLLEEQEKKEKEREARSRIEQDTRENEQTDTNYEQEFCNEKRQFEEIKAARNLPERGRDNISELSDMNTIDEFLHSSTKSDLKNEHMKNEEQIESRYERRIEDGNIDEAIDKLDQTLRKLRMDQDISRAQKDYKQGMQNVHEYLHTEERRARQNRDIEGRGYSPYGRADNYEMSERFAYPEGRYAPATDGAGIAQGNQLEPGDYRRCNERNSRQMDREETVYPKYKTEEYKRRETVKMQLEADRRFEYENDEDLDRTKTELHRLKRERQRILDHSSEYERESLNIRRAQMEQDRKRKLLLESEEKIKQEIEMKQKAEEELMERIQRLEDQQKYLHRSKSENEMFEIQLMEKKKQDTELAMRLHLLKEKEKHLMEKCSVRDEEMSTREKDFDAEKVRRSSGMSAGINYPCERENFLQHPKAEYPLFKMGLPKIPDFNGKQFEQWKMEVVCMIKADIYPDYAIAQAIRHSLKDETRQVLLTLKPTAGAREILQKLNDIYGDIKTGDKVIHDFYSASQQEKESCSSWGIRLETLFQQAVERDEIDESKRDRKLKERFWRGLASEKIKMATRISYESADSFEKLRKKARIEEDDAKSDVKVEASKFEPIAISQQRSSEGNDTILKELLERMKSIESELGQLKTQREESFNRNRWNSGERFRKNKGYGERQGTNNSDQKDLKGQKDQAEEDLN